MYKFRDTRPVKTIISPLKLSDAQAGRKKISAYTSRIGGDEKVEFRGGQEQSLPPFPANTLTKINK